MLKDLVLKNRSYRGYDQTHKISKEQLAEFVDFARLSPSSVNKQPFKYKLVFEGEELDKIREISQWAKGLPHLNLPYEGEQPTAFIVICLDEKIDDSVPRYQKDVGIVAQTMLLAATEAGLGGCMIGNFALQSTKDALGLKDGLTPLLIVAIGKPDEEIVLTEVENGQDTSYYRDENDVHYVPKRKLEDIIL